MQVVMCSTQPHLLLISTSQSEIIFVIQAEFVKMSNEINQAALTIHPIYDEVKIDEGNVSACI